MNKDLNILLARIDQYFMRKRNVRYWLLVTNDPYDHTYNFFFNQQPLGHRKKSIPLHTVTTDLATFEQLMIGLQQHFHFTIEYTGFTGLRWPSTGQAIERQKNKAE